MPISFLTDIVGGLMQKEPDVPEYQQVSPQNEQRRAVAGNIASMPALRTLGELVNAYTTDATRSQMETLFPGISDIKTSVSNVLQEGLRGELPQDVQDLISRRAAERGISAGTAGGQIAQFGELATLGQTSLERIERSMNSAMQWAQLAQSSVNIFNPTQFMVTPALQIQTQLANAQNQFTSEWARNQIEAAYDPSTIAGQSLMGFGSRMNNLLYAIVGRGMGLGSNYNAATGTSTGTGTGAGSATAAEGATDAIKV